ncbi:MAG: MYXO-CTERM sorting domain-containing protein [Myxococcota bacterium]
MQHPSPVFLPLALLAACNSGFETQQGQMLVSDADVVGIEGGGPFLAQTQLCPSFTSIADDFPEGGGDITACFTDSLTGPVVDDGQCLTFTEPGAVEWTFTPTSCQAQDLGWVAVEDHVTLDVVAAADVEAYTPMIYEDYAERAQEEGGLVGEIPGDWRHVEGEPWRIVAGETYALNARLRTRETGEEVAWSGGSYTPGWQAGALPNVAVRAPGVVEVTPWLGTRAGLTLFAGGASFPLAEVLSVPVSAAASLEIVHFYLPAREAPSFTIPYAARAVVRDGDGNLLFGAPVVWESGPIDVTTTTDAYGTAQEYAFLYDACRDPSTVSGPQATTITATLGDLRAELDLTWTPPLTEPDPEWEPSPSCTAETVVVENEQAAPIPPAHARAAAGCSSTGTAPTGAAVLVLAALLARRRRS